MIPVFSNSLGDEELEALKEVFESKWIGPGDKCEQFERNLAEHFGVEDVVLLNSATSGIYLAMKILGVKPGDEVLVPSIHFVATAGAVLEAGAKPVFVDVQTRTLNISPRDIYRKRTSRTVGVIANHYGGHMSNITEIKAAISPGWVFEDAANAPCSVSFRKHAGTLADGGVWSFDSMKPLAMGDGGAVWFPRKSDRLRARRLANYGLSSFSGASNAAMGADKWWQYSVPEPNTKMLSNDILAAIGIQQLKKLGAGLEARKAIWQKYKGALEDVPGLMLPPEPPYGTTSSYYLFWIQTASRDRLAQHLLKNGVYATFRYFPLPTAFGLHSDTPWADWVAGHTLCIPIHHNLAEEDTDKIIDLLRGFDYG